MYFTEAPKLPVEDMATLERLWRAYSDGKFGYAVQRQAFESKKANKLKTLNESKSDAAELRIAIRSASPRHALRPDDAISNYIYSLYIYI